MRCQAAEFVLLDASAVLVGVAHSRGTVSEMGCFCMTARQLAFRVQDVDMIYTQWDIGVTQAIVM